MSIYVEIVEGKMFGTRSKRGWTRTGTAKLYVISALSLLSLFSRLQLLH